VTRFKVGDTVIYKEIHWYGGLVVLDVIKNGAYDRIKCQDTYSKDIFWEYASEFQLVTPLEKLI
jgi:hypothetical protein